MLFISLFGFLLNISLDGKLINNMAGLYGVTIVFMVIFAVMMYLNSNKESKYNIYKNGLIRKRMEYKNLENQEKSLNKDLRQIYAPFNVSNYEDFIKKRNDYNDLVERVAELEGNMDQLHRELGNESRTANILRNSIKEKLLYLGIISVVDKDITKDNIEEFKNGIRYYKELEPKKNYFIQRINELKVQLENFYKHSTELTEMEIKRGNDLNEAISKMEITVSDLQSEWKIKE